MKAVADWWIYGEVDYDHYVRKLKDWGPLIAGILFGAGAIWSSARPLSCHKGGEGTPSRVAVQRRGLHVLNCPAL